MFDLNKQLEQELARALGPKLLKAAEAAEATWRSDLSGGSRSGEFYRNPETGERYQASSASEHPQEVTSQLVDGVTSQPTNDPLTAQVAVRNNPQGKLNQLAFAPASQGGRQLGKASLETDENLDAMCRAMEE